MCAHGAYCIADDAIVQLGSLVVAVIAYCPILTDAHAAGDRHGVHVGAKEDKFPAIALLLALDHLPYLPDGIGGDPQRHLLRVFKLP